MQEASREISCWKVVIAGVRPYEMIRIETSRQLAPLFRIFHANLDEKILKGLQICWQRETNKPCKESREDIKRE